jgi:hypothetical protein
MKIFLRTSREDVKTIEENARRVADIMTNLLAFARQQKLERTYV